MFTIYENWLKCSRLFFYWICSLILVKWKHTCPLQKQQTCNRCNGCVRRIAFIGTSSILIKDFTQYQNFGFAFDCIFSFFYINGKSFIWKYVCKCIHFIFILIQYKLTCRAAVFNSMHLSTLNSIDSIKYKYKFIY